MTRPRLLRPLGCSGRPRPWQRLQGARSDATPGVASSPLVLSRNRTNPVQTTAGSASRHYLFDARATFLRLAICGDVLRVRQTAAAAEIAGAMIPSPITWF